jgi:formylglycine-generating enzyme required for sulfatase activity
MHASIRPSLTLLAAAMLASPAATAVPIGAPGNAADDTGYGAVGYAYEIGQTEVTNTEYAAFLNAVGAADTNNLWSIGMAGTWGGIDRSGSSGSYAYAVKSGFESKPVNFVSFYDALRYVNWLANGQPSGAQGNATTEDGSYTITAQGILDNSIVRNAGAQIVLPNEDEWYKAAYYDALSTSYLDYPAGSDAPTSCVAPSAAANGANCGAAVDTVSDVGAYTGSASPFGTFDQGGNVAEWLEPASGENRLTRGGNWSEAAGELAAGDRNLVTPANENRVIGFRIAVVPEPGTGALVGLGLLALSSRRRERERAAV